MLIQNPPAQVADNLWLLGTYEYPLYLFCGEKGTGADEAALFEAGTSPMGPLVCEQLEHLAVPRETIKHVVIPHAHPDHVMAVPLFREVFPHVTVLASEAAAKTLAAEKAIALFCQIDDAIADTMLKEGWIGEQHRRRPLTENHIAVDQTLKEGDAVIVAGVAFQVLETPGHSECSLSFLQPERGVLLCSDAAGYYMQEHDYWWPNYFSGYQPYLTSIERLMGLNAEILCRGHHGAICGADEVRAHLSDAIAAAKNYHGRIVEQVRSGAAVRQLAEQLGAEVYQKTHLLPLAFFQKNCGLLVKQSLKHEGIGD